MSLCCVIVTTNTPKNTPDYGTISCQSLQPDIVKISAQTTCYIKNQNWCRHNKGLPTPKKYNEPSLVSVTSLCILVCTENAGKQSNISEDIFKWLIEEIVCEILCSHCVSSIFSKRDSPRGLIRSKPHFPWSVTFSPHATSTLISNSDPKKSRQWVGRVFMEQHWRGVHSFHYTTLTFSPSIPQHFPFQSKASIVTRPSPPLRLQLTTTSVFHFLPSPPATHEKMDTGW